MQGFEKMKSGEAENDPQLDPYPNYPIFPLKRSARFHPMNWKKFLLICLTK